MFSPEVAQQIIIDGLTYTIAEHPAAPGMPYGQQGRAATVYQILDRGGAAFALKVFKPAYRQPALAGQAPKLARFSDVPGLKVCTRTVLSAQRHIGLIKQHTDLLYAVVMPWIQGATWHDIIAQKQPLTPEQSLSLARALARVLTEMEERSIAHCDISAANVLLPGLDATSSNGFAVELVDVEQLYASDMQRPNPLIAGTPGYLPQDLTGAALWNVTGDRFAGAVLLAELLGWCDERVRTAAHEGSYFQQDEMQADSQRYRTLLTVLQEHWGPEIAKRFSSVWKSQSLVECPLFGDWLVNLPDTVPEYQITTTVIPEIDESDLKTAGNLSDSGETAQPGEPDSSVDGLIALAHKCEQQKDWPGAVKIYRQALEFLPSDSGLAREIQGIIRGLELKSGEGGETPPKVSWHWLLAGGMAILAVVAFLVTQNSQTPPVMPTATSAIVLVQATATETSIPATYTPRPTNTPMPRPTNTPTPRPTNTPTPRPTNTPTPSPTNTPRPTSIPTPTAQAELMTFTVWNASKEEFNFTLCGPSQQQFYLPPCTYHSIRIPIGIYGWGFGSQCSVPEDPSWGIGPHSTSLCIYPNDDGSARGTSTQYYCEPDSKFWSICNQ